MNTPTLFSQRSPLTAALLLCAVALSACGTVQRGVPAGETVSDGFHSGSGATETSHSLSSVQSELYSAHEQWEGTPYLLGGSSSRGVDCSSFMQIVFDRHFGVDLPRNTRHQMQEGVGVRRRSLQPGDLVFFRTGRRDLHVGVVVEGNRFLHASVSSGVMLSGLDENYWASRFLAARRVFL